MLATAATTESCDCPKCRELCVNPGWMTPSEARAAIAAGYAERMMVDYLTGDPTIFVLCPASRHCEGDRAPNTQELGGFSIFAHLSSKGRCVLQAEDGKCSIHDSGFKPRQCREALGCRGTYLDNYAAAEDWRSEEAQALVREWMQIVGMDEDDLAECT